MLKVPFSALACALGLCAVVAAPVSQAATAKKATTTAKKTASKTTTKATSKAKTSSKSTNKTTTSGKASSEITATTEKASDFNTTPAFAVPVTTEPTLATVSYPKYDTVSLQGTDIIAQSLTNVPMPTMSISDVNTLATVVIPQSTEHTTQLDVSVVDDFINYVSPMARHYPPVFSSATQRYNAIERVKHLGAWIDTYAKAPNASYDVLLRAAKLNAIGRNLDLGSDYAVRGSSYIARALKLNDTAEANFLYGSMLAEGGGFAEGSKYLEKAESMGFAEATQSLAQADLLDDKKERAIQRLNEFKQKYPNNPYIDEQLRLVNSGQYYIWNIPSSALRTQPAVN